MATCERLLPARYACLQDISYNRISISSDLLRNGLYHRSSYRDYTQFVLLFFHCEGPRALEAFNKSMRSRSLLLGADRVHSWFCILCQWERQWNQAGWHSVAHSGLVV